jgi:hypothetical protein
MVASSIIRWFKYAGCYFCLGNIGGGRIAGYAYQYTNLVICLSRPCTGRKYQMDFND